MKILILASLCAVMAFITAPTFGLNVTFDENGNGTFNGTPLVWGIGAMPVSPSQPYLINTLFYDLPFGVVEGDLQVIEPDGTISDVLRFVNNPTANTSRIYVYSDRDPLAPDFDLADTVIPPVPWQNVVVVPESGSEGSWNGVSWAPGFTDPGATSAPITYDFTSDVPEPATMCLLGLGGLLLRRKSK